MKRAPSLITQTLNANIVISLDVPARNPVLMWNQLATDDNTMTLAHRSAARKEFLNCRLNRFVIAEEETFLDVKMAFNGLLRIVTVQGGVVRITLVRVLNL